MVNKTMTELQRELQKDKNFRRYEKQGKLIYQNHTKYRENLNSSYAQPHNWYMCENLC